MNLIKELNKRFLLQKEYLGENKVVNSIKPIVSVVVATYQHEKYIEKCLDGILMQETNFPVEIIVGEDGSNDGTRNLCIKYAEKYSDKIRLFLRDRSLSQLYDKSGKFITFFNGKWLRMSARGKYIALCEGDDFWTDPNKLQKQVDFMLTNPDYSTVFHKVDWLVQETGEKFAGSYGPPTIKSEYSTDDLLESSNFLPTCSVLFRNRFDNYPEWYLDCRIGDFPLHIMNSLDGKIGYIDQSMGVYRRHSGGLHGGQSESFNIKRSIETYEIIGQNLNLNTRKSYRLKVSKYYHQLFEIYELKNEKELSLDYLKSANTYTEVRFYSLKKMRLKLPFCLTKKYFMIMKLLQTIKATTFQKLYAITMARQNSATR